MREAANPRCCCKRLIEPRPTRRNDKTVMTPWELPQTTTIGGVRYQLNADFRDVLEIMEYLNDPEKPEILRWQIAVAIFFGCEDFPEEHLQEAMEYLAAFISCGDESSASAPKLLDWEQDAQIIVADVNRVAGMEVRSVPYLHWWTFLSYFRAIGEGQLLTLVSIREKLRTGKKLEQWEREYYHKNPERVILKTKYLAEEEDELDALKRLLGG